MNFGNQRIEVETENRGSTFMKMGGNASPTIKTDLN